MSGETFWDKGHTNMNLYNRGVVLTCMLVLSLSVIHCDKGLQSSVDPGDSAESSSSQANVTIKISDLETLSDVIISLENKLDDYEDDEREKVENRIDDLQDSLKILSDQYRDHYKEEYSSAQEELEVAEAGGSEEEIEEAKKAVLFAKGEWDIAFGEVHQILSNSGIDPSIAEGDSSDAQSTTSVSSSHLSSGGSSENGTPVVGSSGDSAPPFLSSSIAYNPNNYAPIISEGDSVTVEMNEDGLFDLRLHATDSDSTDLFWSIKTGPTFGEASVGEVGNRVTVEYKPNNHYSGLDSFVVIVSDGQDTDEIFVTVSIQELNDAPVFSGQVTITGIEMEDQNLTLHINGTCTDPNDLEASTPAISYLWFRDVDSTGGDGVIVTSGNVYKLTEDDLHHYMYGKVLCTDEHNIQMAKVTDYTGIVVPSDVAPTIEPAPANLTVDEDGILIFPMSATDPDGDLLTWTVPSGAHHGTPEVQGTGKGDTVSIKYSPTMDYNGMDSLLIVAKGVKHADSLYVSIQITPKNDLPSFKFPAWVSGQEVQGFQMYTGVECTDATDHREDVEISHVWYRDLNDSGYKGNEFATEGTISLTANEVGQHLYVITTCTDNDNASIYDTTDYTIAIFSEPSPSAEYALTFDGVNEYIELPPLNLYLEHGITFEAWVTWDNTNNWARIFEMGNGFHDNSFIVSGEGLTNNLSIESYSDGHASNIIIPNFITKGHWTHLAVTVTQSGEALVYKNGIQIYTGWLNISSNIERNKNFIGYGNVSASDGYFDGKIDDIRIWDDVRSADEIHDMMYGSVTTGDENLFAAWNFNNVSGEVLWDIRTARFNGFLKNMDDGNWVDSYTKRSLTISHHGGGSVENYGLNDVASTMQFPLKVIPKPGFEFIAWTIVKGTVTIGNAALEDTWVEVTGESASVVATFKDVGVPVPPPSVYSTDHTDTSMVVRWSGATDNAKIAGYKVFQDGDLLANTSGNSVMVSNLSINSFTVVAYDEAGNESVASKPLLHVEIESFDSKDGVTVNDSGIFTFVEDLTNEDFLKWNSITLAAGTYTLRSRLSSSSNSTPLVTLLSVNGSYVGKIDLSAYTGGAGWNVLSATHALGGVEFTIPSSGTFPIEVHFWGAEFFCDWIEIEPVL